MYPTFKDIGKVCECVWVHAHTRTCVYVGKVEEEEKRECKANMVKS